MKRRITITSIVFLCLALLIGAVAFVAAPGALKPARADDSSHTTTFFLGTEQGATTINCTSYSTDNSDQSARVVFYVTPSGQSEFELGGATAKRRHTGGSGLVIDEEEAIDFASGTQFRAHFTWYDSNSSETYSYDRYLTLP